MLNISTPPFVKIGVSSYSDEFMIDVIDIIRRLQQAKKDAGIEPCIVGMVEIQQEASHAALEELRRLYKEGKVVHHELLNGHAFSVDEV